MASIAVPRPVATVLALPGCDYLAALALTSPFLVSGVVKFLDFPGAVGEIAEHGLQPPSSVAAAVVTPPPDGSLGFLTRRWCWLGAGMLSVFTVVAILITHPFWSFDGADRGRQTASFFARVAVVGDLAKATLLAGRQEDVR